VHLQSDNDHLLVDFMRTEMSLSKSNIDCRTHTLRQSEFPALCLIGLRQW